MAKSQVIGLSSEENDMYGFSKCGEIFIAKNGWFKWICVLCEQQFTNAESCQLHVLQNHISDLCRTTIEVKKEIDFSTGPISTPNYKRELEVFEENNSKYKQHYNESKDICFSKKINITKIVKVVLERNKHLEESLKQKWKKKSKLKTNATYHCHKCDHVFNCKMVLQNHLKNFHVNDETDLNQLNDIVKKEYTSNCKDHLLSHGLSEPNKIPLSESGHNFEFLKSLNEETTADIHKIVNDSEELVNFKKAELKLTLTRQTICFSKSKYEKIVSNTENNFKQRKERTKIANTSKKHVCEICGKESSTKYNLNNHIKLRHNTDDRKKYSCDQCQKAFVKEQSLQNHIKIFHLKEKPFICNIDKCERRFVDEKSLKYHQAFHTNERKFTCSKCGKKYLHKSKLDAHVKIYHVLGRIHHCRECNKSFYDPYTLRKHMICHTGEKPFACDECPARFPRENALQWHKKVHSGVKDHICKLCGQAFYLFTGLYAHMKTHGIKYNKKIEKGLVPIEKLCTDQKNLETRLKSKENSLENFKK